MYKELYSLLKSNQDKELSEEYFYDAFDIMIKNDKELISFIEDFIIQDDLEGEGEYNTEERIIRVNPEMIIDNEYGYISDKVTALQVIKHEMEHARGLKRLYEGRHDIESIVNEYALAFYIQKYGVSSNVFLNYDNSFGLNFKIKANYLYNPGERIADIKSRKFIVNLLKNQRVSDELLRARKYLYLSLIRGYDDNGIYLDAPTYTFLLNLNLFRNYYLLKKTVDSSHYSLDTRVLCGLPITYDERENVLLRKVRLQRRKNNK